MPASHFNLAVRLPETLGSRRTIPNLPQSAATGAPAAAAAPRGNCSLIGRARREFSDSRPRRRRWVAAGLALTIGLVGFIGGPVLRAADAPAAGIPAGYRLLYQQDFASADALRDFEFSDPAAWRWSGSAEGRPGALELFQQSQYAPRVRSPLNLALIAGHEFGDFVLEVDMVQTGREYGHRDMVVVFAAKDPANFYYAHIATKTDDHAHNVFLVKLSYWLNV